MLCYHACLTVCVGEDGMPCFRFIGDAYGTRRIIYSYLYNYICVISTTGVW
jgi:hypothetical protein